MKQPVLGSDPEFFVKREKNIISASDLFPDKFTKMQLDDKGKEVFYDGIQAEINVPPSESIRNIVETMNETLKLLTEFVESKGCQIVIAPAVDVDQEVLEKAPEEAVIFGCDVDFNAYTKKPNPTHRNMTKHLIRYAGGHLHLGFNHIEKLYELIYYKMEVVEFIQLMDAVVGVPCVLLDRSGKNLARRKFYGKAGCFRTTEYGVEYRTLSNFWLKSPVFTDIVHRLSRMALRIALANMSKWVFRNVSLHTIKKAINSNDFSLASQIVSRLKEYVLKPASLKGDPWYSEDKRLDLAFDYLVSKRTYERMNYKKAWEGPQTLEEFYDCSIKNDKEFVKFIESKGKGE